MPDVGLHPLEYISLCAGGGGLDLGFELAVRGARPCLYVEREAFACAHLVEAMQAGILADAPVWSDARTLDGRPWRGLVDGIIGGIPCQPHSVAGRKRGSHDERDLWSDARRIIVQARPWFVLIENVGGMLSAGADEIAGAERVWRDLRRMGFDVEAGLFTAAEVGAPHKRERLFILGVADASDGLRWTDGRSGGAGPREGGDEARGRGIRQGHGRPDDERPEPAGPHVADPGRERDAGRGTARDLRSPAHEDSGQEEERQRHGHAAGNGGADVADASSERGAPRISRPIRPEQEGFAGEPANHRDALEHPDRPRPLPAAHPGIRRGEEGAGARHGQPERSGGRLEHTPSIGRGEGRAEPELRGGRRSATGAGGAMAHPDRRQPQGWAAERGEAPERRAHDEPSGSGLGLFPPGPGDLAAWADVIARAPQFEPAVRRVADGLASTRTDWLRLLGNGVVPLAAAYAVRTLVSRLAARSPAAAALDVRVTP